MEEIKRFKKMPFEIYFNAHTEQYHFIEHLGYMKNGKAWKVKVHGRYESFMKAKERLEQILEEEGYEWEMTSR